MLEENSNLKSHIKDTAHLPSIGKVEIFRLGSYNKTNKLVSALYMVTDIMDKEEPLRIKLRNLGSNIISDIHSLDKGQALYNRIDDKVSEILSFLEIASSVGVVSNMNSSILMKEFIDLRKSISEIVPKEDQNWLEEFMKEGQISEREILEKRAISIGQASTRIGVQKGSTLLQALSKVGGKIVSDRTQKIVNSPTDNNGQHAHSSNSFRNENNDLLKNKRREEIISIITIIFMIRKKKCILLIVRLPLELVKQFLI